MDIETLKTRIDEIEKLQMHLKRISNVSTLSLVSSSCEEDVKSEFAPVNTQEYITKYKENVKNKITALKNALDEETTNPTLSL